jgi:hypothetical protein
MTQKKLQKKLKALQAHAAGPAKPRFIQSAVAKFMALMKGRPTGGSDGTIRGGTIRGGPSPGPGALRARMSQPKRRRLARGRTPRRGANRPWR